MLFTFITKQTFNVSLWKCCKSFYVNLLLMNVIYELPLDFTEGNVAEGETEEHVAVPDLRCRHPVRPRAPGHDPQHHLHL